MTDPTPATPDEAVEPNGGPIEAFALALDIDSWAEAVDLSERSVPNLRSIGWELRRFDDGMDWRSAYLHLLESWAAVCEMTGIESDSSPEEVVEALSRQQALPLPSERGGQGDTVAARAGRLVSLGYWVSVGRAYDVPVRACVFSEEEDADATADGPTIEAALRDLVAYVERPCVCGHAWASHQPEYDYPVWASHCTHPADDGCGRWEDPEPRREPIPVAPGQVDMGIGADGAGEP